MSKGVQRCLGSLEVSIGVQSCPEVSTGVQRCLQVSTGVPTCSEVSRGVMRCLEDFSRYPEVFRGV